MDMLIPFSEVFLAGIIHSLLQLGLGVLLLLYHASLGKHVQRRTRNLVDSYIGGVGISVFLVISAIAFLLNLIFGKPLYTEELMIVVGMLVALAVATWAIYYRRGRSTELWLPRTVAKFIDNRAEATNSNTEAFSLGILTSLAEMPFTMVLFLIAGNSLLRLDPNQQLLAVAIYTILAVLPLVILRIAIRHGKTVVDVQRWRVNHKMFLRVITGLGFLALAIFIFGFEVVR